MDRNQSPQGFETIEVTVCDVGDNVANYTTATHPNVATPNPNVATPPTLPCSRRAAGKALGCTDVTVGRWVKALESQGQEVVKKGKITALGWSALVALKEATETGQSLSDYLATLPTPTPITATAAGGGALVITHRETVSLATGQALAREAGLKAEFFALLGEEQEDQAFESEIAEMRLAKIRERAYREFLQEEKEAQRIKRELRAAKLTLELGGDHRG